MATNTFVGVDALLARVMPELEAAVLETTDEVLTEIETQATPIDTGDLEGTEKTIGPIVATRSVSEKIVAGAGLDYAIIVHQKDAIHHDHGTAHFVARPVLAAAPKLRERVAEAGRKAY